MKKKISLLIRDEGGAITIMTIIMMVAFVGIMALIIDLGHLHTVQSELRNAADACALRGARAFYPNSISGLENADPPNPDNAKTQASETIGINRSDNVRLVDLPTAGIQVGIWDYTARQLTAWRALNSDDFNTYVGPGIALTVSRDEAYNLGPVSMTLAMFWKAIVPVNVDATAALSGIGGFVPGSPVLPFGTWDDMLTGTPPQELPGTFRNDGTDTLGWTNLDPNDTNPNARQLKDLLTDPTGASTPNCPTGSTVGIQNGVVASAIQAMTKQTPLNRFGLVETLAGGNVYEPSTDINPLTGDPLTGEPPVSYKDTVYMMPVYMDGSAGGDKFNQSAVVGAVAVKIVRVTTSPENTIDLTIVGGPPYIAPGSGGGKYYGILSTEPKIVQ